MKAPNLLYRTQVQLGRLAQLSVLLMLTACVQGGDSGSGGGSDAGKDCDHTNSHHHHHADWGDDRGTHHHEYDDNQGHHHHEWDDDQGVHHHEWCDDHGNHNHDWDDSSHHHHHQWNDDSGHDSSDWDDHSGHHHNGNDDNHSGYNTNTSTSTATSTDPCTNSSTSTSTSTSSSSSTVTSTVVSVFPDLPGRTCNVDAFQQPTSGTTYVRKVDILFVMDHSGSMGRHWQEIAQNIEAMVKQLPSSTDIRYAVMLADVGTWSGRLYSPLGKAYLDNQLLSTNQVAQALQSTFSSGMKVSDAGSGEASLYSLLQGVTVRAADNQKAGFFRADAALSVIFMSDEKDIGMSVSTQTGIPPLCDATFEAGVKKAYYDAKGTTVDTVLAAVKKFKGDLPVKAHAFVNITKADVLTDNSAHASCIYDSIGIGYIDFVNNLKGTLYSIHNDKATGLAQCGHVIAQSLALQHDFSLSHPASEVDSATILSAVDGSLVAATYSADTDAVHLDNAGTYGSTVQVRYCAPIVVPTWTLTNFAGTASQNSAALSWLTAQHATSGKVMWGTSASSLSNEADDANVTTNHAVTVNGLTPNTTYYFQATSVDESGVTHSSSVISLTTLPQWTLAGVSAQAGRTSASVLWNTAAYPTSGYVNWGLSASALTQQTAAASVATIQNVALSGLSPATTYYYQVVAHDTFNQTQSSAVQSFTTESDWGISGFTGAATRTSVTLEWQTADQVTVGAILWGRSSALGQVASEGAAAANNHALTVSGLNPDTDYYFEVQASDPSGVVKTSNMLLVHTSIDWSMTGFAGISTQNTVTLTWTTPGYTTSGQVAWGLSGASLPNVVIDTANGTSHSVTVSGLSPDTTYHFQATSTDADGITKASTVAAIATQPLPLPTWSISGLAGTSTTSSVTITWQTAQYATSGSVLFGTSTSALSGQQADSVVGSNHSVTINGLTAGTTYFFQVAAADDRGQTQTSDVIQVVTMTDTITPPNNWVIVGFDGTTTSSQVNLIWQTPGAATTATVNVGISPTDLTLLSIPVNTPASTQTVVVPGLNASTTYYFQLTATDTSGRTVQSSVIAKTTKAQ